MKKISSEEMSDGVPNLTGKTAFINTRGPRFKETGEVVDIEWSNVLEEWMYRIEFKDGHGLFSLKDFKIIEDKKR